MTSALRVPGSAAFAFALVVGTTAAFAATVTDPGFEPLYFAGGPGELSGLAPAPGGRHVAVGDGGTLVELAISVDLATGEVTDVVPGAETPIEGDTEGVATDLATGRLWVSDEVGPAIRELEPATGEDVGAVGVPAIFAQARANRSLESLARDPRTGALWTANEGALVPDGELATFTEGTAVRLQRFDADGTPSGQWAYLAEPMPGAPFQGNETNGVVELLALPSGELLVLERSLSSLLFDARIYQVDFAGATDTSSLASLTGEAYTPAAKSLLWSASTTFSNFEGMALGPELAAGDFALYLVADDGGTAGQAIYPLRVAFVPEAPRALLLVTALGALASRRSRPSRSASAAAS
jgi:hypothetical protein